ncbi:MAG: ImmA/IrrE family metallo-endopeptidase [Planctomycetes bacterium]|nr:ImmA/IrrE family metallo-endopeptidase [Planctomycetota bacterium]
MPIKAPFLPYDKLREVADTFLAEHHPEGTLPVPIERIAEYEFDLDIVAIPGLQNNLEMESAPSKDLKTVYIDEFVYKNRPNRYRFSLAHELAHIVLHKDIIAELDFSSVFEWKAVVAGIPHDQLRWIEFQAYSLGGLILVQEKPLHDHFSTAVDAARSVGAISSAVPSEEVRKMVESYIASPFEVSAGVISRRVKADNLWDSIE